MFQTVNDFQWGFPWCLTWTRIIYQVGIIMKLLQFDYTDRYKIGTAQISSKCCVWSKNPQFWLYYTWYKRWFKFIFHILNILKFLRRLIRLLRIYTGSRKWHLIWPKCQLKISLQFYGLVPFILYSIHRSQFF